MLQKVSTLLKTPKTKVRKTRKMRQLQSDIKIKNQYQSAKNRSSSTSRQRMPNMPQERWQVENQNIESDSAIDINTPRQSPTLQSQVDRHMACFPTYEQQQQTNRYSHAEPGDDDTLEQYASVVGKKTFKPDRTAELYDDIQYLEIWPHTKLTLEFASREITYDQFNTKLCVADYIVNTFQLF